MRPGPGLLGIVALALGLAAGSGAAEAPAPLFSGRVFVDEDRDGRFSPGEPGVAGAVVHNGHEIARSDGEGRYRLPPGPGPFVVLTRPAGYACDRWYRPARERGGDFALVPRPESDDFLFLHFSDAHVYPAARDFHEHSMMRHYSWLPDWVRHYGLVRMLRRRAATEGVEDFDARFARVLEEHLGAGAGEGLWSVGRMRLWLEAFLEPGSAMGDVESRIRAAFDEMAGLGADFAIHTGDALLEGNDGSIEAAERWMAFYRELREALGTPVYDTLGNNELAGTGHAALRPDDPRFGKGLYRRDLGPTFYSFDRGPFHFVALDTHSPEDPEDPRDWSFETMEPRIREWLAADLAAHADRVLVVLNHEPFAWAPQWSMDEDDFEPIEGDAILAAAGVDYTFSGHIHEPGSVVRDGIEHYSAGALSGLRWLVPGSLYPQGYLLVRAREGRLHTAWKTLGQPLLEVVRVEEEGPSVQVVVAAADVSGPLPGLRLSADGRTQRLERWGPYFAAARLEGGVPEVLVLEALRLDGSGLRREWRPEAPDGAGP